MDFENQTSLVSYGNLDENIDYKIIRALRESGIDTYSVGDKNSGFIDE